MVRPTRSSAMASTSCSLTRIELIHGPGCPVCVTPLGVIDKALAIASWPDVIFCSFGDMLRVPGSGRDLFQVKSEGGDVRVVYSPLDAVALAAEHPDREVVFFAIGFETTAPANAMAVHLANRRGLTNFSVLVSHVLVPPAIEAIVSSPSNRVDGFLAAGHVCSVMGTWQYGPLVERFGLPIVVTGFEPLDVLDGIRRVVVQLKSGTARLENAYERVVTEEGNLPAQQMLAEVFDVCDRQWRGIGEIPASGWRLSDRYRTFDAEATVRRRRNRQPGVGSLPERRSAPRPDQAVRVRGVRRGVHAPFAARSDDGVERRRVRGLLPVPAARCLTGPTSRGGAARCRYATTTASSSVTAAGGSCRVS